MTSTIQLRQNAEAKTEATAWFIPGDSTARWLEELARCGLAETATRLSLVPRSSEDRRPAGLLAVPAEGSKPGSTPAGLAYKLLGGRLFVPIDAQLHPPVTDAELKNLCPWKAALFHPAFGLSAFEEESALHVWDLLEPAVERAANWNCAVAGPMASPELQATVLAQPPTREDMFGDASNEIGTDSPADLPAAPGEPGADPLSESRRNLKRMFMRGLEKFLEQFPDTGSRKSWVNAAENWVSKHMQRIDAQLEQLRNKELHRLLHLLETDPEAGLRHAIPMNSFPHRGIAPPGGHLGSHSLNFDPQNIGGRPADFWNVPLNMQEVLRRRYREMADREMQLGRHRRAAYIYAELLGDLVSAAHTLKKGRLFREAALLYDEHLHNPLEAAHCLAEAGLLQEAVEKYEKLGRWLEAAELHERLGNTEAAAAALRRVVDEGLAQNDYLAAAKLIEERLHSPDEAVEVLRKAWPGSHQAVASVGALLSMLARLGRHDAALERVVEIGKGPVPFGLTIPLVNALSSPARTYPDVRVRHRASDISRILIAKELKRPALGLNEAGRLTDFLIRLAPEDRLLTRDSNRYLEQRRSSEFRSRPALPPPVRGNMPVLLRRFDLPRQIQWLQLKREWHWFFALGTSSKHLTLIRGIWEGQFQSLSWECPAAAVKSGFVFEPTAQLGKCIALARADGPALALKRFPASDLFFGQECVAGTPSWLPRSGFPFAFGEETVVSAQIAEGQVVISIHDKQGRPLRTIDVTSDLLQEAERTEATRLCLATLPGTIAVALGNRLVLTGEDEGYDRVELPGQVVKLLTTLPHTREGIIALLETGAVMYWMGDDKVIELDSDLPAPMGALIPGGPIVLVSGHQCLLLDVDARGVHNVIRFPLSGQRPVGVSGTAGPGQFAILGEQGEMTVYKIPISDR